ncbi:pectate lyase [Opitutaceae bacterium TAV5]|nr:pectate lyase [Opitutaceae bacterium TAV5]
MPSFLICIHKAVTTACLSLLLAGALHAAPAAASGVTPSAPPPLTLALVGDSTVANYPPGHPRRGWGQLLPEFLAPNVNVLNEARGGRSTKSFEAKYWTRVLSAKPDFIFIQFGHNDSHAKDKPEATDAATDYRDNLRRYVTEARAAGATPVLVTPVSRRTFRKGQLTDRLAPYADAMRIVATETKTPLVDLHKSSADLFTRLGEAATDDWTLNNAGQPDQTGPGDRTHFTETGAREIARLVAEALPAIDPRLVGATVIPSGSAVSP